MKYNLAFITTTLLLSSLLSASSCKKDNSPATEEQLPPETHIGAFTFGCKVDGIVYKASGKGGLLANQHMYYNFLSDSTFDIGAGSIIEKKFNINLSFKCSALNTPILLSGSPFQATFHDNSDGTIPGNSNTYTTTDLYKGYAIIKYFNGTLYPGNSGTIAAGTFEMQCINANGKIIKITEGRFDIGQ